MRLFESGFRERVDLMLIFDDFALLNLHFGHILRVRSGLLGAHLGDDVVVAVEFRDFFRAPRQGPTQRNSCASSSRSALSSVSW